MITNLKENIGDVFKSQAESYSWPDKLRDTLSQHVECRLPAVLFMQYFSGQAFNETDTESSRYASVQYLNAPQFNKLTWMGFVKM
jgi:hypothetical protein